MYSFSCLEPACCSMSSSNCCFLTCIQVSQNTGKVVWYSHLWEFSIVCCDPHKSFSVFNEAEVDISLEFSCFLHDPTNVGNLISGSSALQNPACTSGISLAWKILSITLLAWEMSATVHYLNILYYLFSLGMNWKLTSSSPVATAEFSKFADILSAALGFDIAHLDSITSTGFVRSDAS